MSMKHDLAQAKAVLEGLDSYPVKVFAYASKGVRDITSMLSDSQQGALEDLIREFMEDIIEDIEDSYDELEWSE